MAVSSYKFLAMYIMISILVGILAGVENQAIAKAEETDYDFYNEIIYTNEKVLKNSDTLVKSDNYIVNKVYGDEVAQQKNFARIFLNVALPSKLIPKDYTASDFERSLDSMFMWFRWILLIFAGFELYQIIINKKTD